MTLIRLRVHTRPFTPRQKIRFVLTKQLFKGLCAPYIVKTRRRQSRRVYDEKLAAALYVKTFSSQPIKQIEKFLLKLGHKMYSKCSTLIQLLLFIIQLN